MVLDELIPEVLLSTLKPCINTKLQNSIFNPAMHKTMDLSILSIVHHDKNPWLEAQPEFTKIQNLLQDCKL
jgi:hypothetical protein